MLRLKPTTIIALDPHTAAFSDEVRRHLERDFGARGRLIQAHALVRGDDGALRLESSLAAVTDTRFDLEAVRGEAKRAAVDDAQALFEREASGLEITLGEILGAGRRVAEREAAMREGIEIARERMIYLLLSASDPFAGSVALELTRLIQWLFARRFTQELKSLHAVVMLPGLFRHAKPPDYAAAYALLKKIDHGIATGLAQQKTPLLDGCWLLDGTNARGDETGTLAEELESYAAAFAGFLTAEPEMSGALPGTRKSREGYQTAYSSFGHGELYFPAAVAVRRLSSALARDIIIKSFLGAGGARPDADRRLLLAAKQFVLGAGYTGEMGKLESDNGKLIWRGFDPRVELQRETGAREHVSELRLQHSKFERESLPEFQRALLAQSEAVRVELTGLLDAEIDRRADADAGGLAEARALLKKLIDPGIALSADALGEHPQNLITELRAAEGMLDQRLGVEIDSSRTKGLLDRVSELRTRLIAQETTLRLIGAPEDGPAAAPPPPPRHAVVTADGEQPPEEETSSEAADASGEREGLLAEIEETKAEIQAGCSEYEHALIEEQRAAYHLRRAAQEQTRAAKAKAIADAEEEVTKLSDELGKARTRLDELQEERRKFLIRHFIIYPAVAALLFVVPGLGALLGLSIFTLLVGFFWEYLFAFLLGILVAAALYTARVLYSFLTGINREVNEARRRVEFLEGSLKAAVVRLRRARDDQSRLEYELYAQGMRVETLKSLIETARRRAGELNETLLMLEERRAAFAAAHDGAAPTASTMRRPVLSAADMDAYYLKAEDAHRKAGAFVPELLKRSEVRRLTSEEFAARLEGFTQDCFRHLKGLSIQDALLREPELIPARRAETQLRELDGAAEPLVQLRDMNPDEEEFFAQRDVTIWAGPGEYEMLLETYRKINPNVTIRPSESDQSLRTLTRCLNFPAYLLSQLGYYRDCYSRAADKEAEALPDLIPDVRRAHRRLLLAIATGLITRDARGNYILTNGGSHPLGENRRLIAEKLVTDYSYQTIYAELSALLKEREADRGAVYQCLVNFIESADGLDSSERETLDALAQKYHPLR